MTTLFDSPDSNEDIFQDLLHKSLAEFKKDNWGGFLREVRAYRALLVTHHNQPEAVVLSIERYQELARLAQREKVHAAQLLAALGARFDLRLASLNSPSAYHALNAFMDEPVDWDGRLRREDAS